MIIKVCDIMEQKEVKEIEKIPSYDFLRGGKAKGKRGFI